MWITILYYNMPSQDTDRPHQDSTIALTHRVSSSNPGVISVPPPTVSYPTPMALNILSPDIKHTIKNGDENNNNIVINNNNTNTNNNNQCQYNLTGDLNYYNHNNNGIEPPPLPPTSISLQLEHPPRPQPMHRTIQTLPASFINVSGGGGGGSGGGGGGGGGSGEIDSYTPNGVPLALGVIDSIPLCNTQVDRRCQHRLTPESKRVIEPTNTFTTKITSTNTTTTTTTATTAPSHDNIKGRNRTRHFIPNRPVGSRSKNNNYQIYKRVVNGKDNEPRKNVRNSTKIIVTKPDSSTVSWIPLDFEFSVKGSEINCIDTRDSNSIRKSSRLKSEEEDVFLPLEDTHSLLANRTLRIKRYLEDRVRAMYSQRRLNAPLSARSHGQRPRSSTHHRPHSSRGGSNSALDDGSSDTSQQSSIGLSLLAKFRLVARMTILLIRLMKAIIDNSNDLTTRSAAELQWLTVYGRDTEATMAFNKNLYSRDRVMTHIPEWAMNILQLDPERRTELHCRRLHALLRGLKSFDKFTDEIQMSLCRAFRLEIVTEGRILLKHGHIGVYFYFIYSGSVFVNAQDKASNGKSFMRTITVLTRGQSFGELALLQDIKRTATVSVREKCELLVVDKEVFARVCPQIFEKELEEKRNVLSGMSLFPNKWWGPDDMRALSMEAQIQEFKINKVIVPDSSLEDWIYTCIEGKCQVIHCLSPLPKSSVSGDQRRKTSDIVLSEEIIDLLSSATSNVTKTNEQEVDADIKEKLLSSLGLDYVATGKRRHAYVKDDVEKERLRAIQGLDDATTLTALMKKREETRKGLVYLNVGVIEPGEVFDLHSLVRDDRETLKQTACLMLVSGGAKILKIRKAAFFEHASEQALEHTRTLASKERFLSDEDLIESYKEKKKWEKYKSNVVQSVLNTKRHTRGLAETQNGTPCSSRTQTPRPKSCRSSRSARSSRTQMSAGSRQLSQNGADPDNQATDLVLKVMQKENQIPQQQTSTHSCDNAIGKEDAGLDRLNESVNNSTTVQNGTESCGKVIEFEMDTERPISDAPSFDTDAIIIRRHPARTAVSRGRVMRTVGARPHTVHPRFSTR